MTDLLGQIGLGLGGIVLTGILAWWAFRQPRQETPPVRRCPDCDAELEPTWSFCRLCGRGLIR